MNKTSTGFVRRGGKGSERFLVVLGQKLKEAFLSVFPIILIVLILSVTVSPLDGEMMLRFSIGAFLIVVGLAVFLFGVEIGVAPVGQHMGRAVARSNKILIVVVAGLLLGFLISVAEPDLHILAGQVDSVTAGLITKLGLVLVVSAGIAVLLSAGLVRILYNFPLNIFLTAAYLVIFVLSLLAPPEYLAIAFDASGATTGALTVPFILALSFGVSALKKDSRASEKDSFGLVAITSAGAIISVLVMNIVSGAEGISGGPGTGEAAQTGIIAPFIHELPDVALEIFIALFPILALFLIFQKASFKLSKSERRRIILGLVYAFAGLVLLLTGVNAGFMSVGEAVGARVAALGSEPLLIGTGFVLGLVTVLAEPAVHALTDQIEAVTSGYVKRRTVLAALCIGIGLAVALAMVRILIPGLKLWHFLLPGYLISLSLTYVVPKLFVGIAFDSGGVASGPMTATFILAFAQGAAAATGGADVLLDGFGVIAMVALTPLITLQILGLIYKIKSRKEGVEGDG